MKYDETITNNEIEESAEDVVDGEATPADIPDEVKKPIIHQAEKSARKIIEERLERQRLRHEVDYLSDLDEENDAELDDLDDEPEDER